MKQSRPSFLFESKRKSKESATPLSAECVRWRGKPRDVNTSISPRFNHHRNNPSCVYTHTRKLFSVTHLTLSSSLLWWRILYVGRTEQDTTAHSVRSSWHATSRTRMSGWGDHLSLHVEFFLFLFFFFLWAHMKRESDKSKSRYITFTSHAKLASLNTILDVGEKGTWSSSTVGFHQHTGVTHSVTLVFPLSKQNAHKRK